MFGLDNTIITFIARAEAAGDRARSRALFRLAVFLVVCAMRHSRGDRDHGRPSFGDRLGLDPQMVAALSVMLCAMPVVALYRICTAVSRGMKVMRHDIFSRGMTETIVTTLAFLAALWLGLEDIRAGDRSHHGNGRVRPRGAISGVVALSFGAVGSRTDFPTGRSRADCSATPPRSALTICLTPLSLGWTSSCWGVSSDGRPA